VPEDQAKDRDHSDRYGLESKTLKKHLESLFEDNFLAISCRSCEPQGLS
jgi:hypothetical protein